MRYGILGQLEVHQDGRRASIAQGRQRLLLAVLLVYANEPVSSERLIDALWSDPPPSSAARGLHNLVSGLRKGLGEGHLLTEAHGYRLCVADEDLDASRFLALCTRGRAARAQGQPARAAHLLGEALALWRGPAFGDLAAEECLRSEANRLEEHRLTAVEDRIEAELALGPQRELVAEIEALVAAHPLRERLREYQMLALYRSGRQADALAAYTHTRQHFVMELGIEPGPALRELEQAVLDQDPALSCPPALPVLPHAPVSAARRPWRMAVAGAVLLAVAIAAALAIDDAERPPTPAAVAGDSLVAIDPALNRVVEEVTVGDTPTRVAAGTGVVWALNADDRTVSRVDVRTKTVRTFSAETTPIDLAANGDELWIAQAAPSSGGSEYLGAASVTQVDPVTGAGRGTTALTVPAQAALPVLPGGLIAAADDAVWTLGRPGWVHRIDERTGRLRTQRSLQALGIATGEGQVWIRDRLRRAVRLDPVTGRVLARVALPARWIDAIAVGGHAVWLTASSEGTLWRVDPERLRVRTIDVGVGADSVAVGAGAVWVANSVDGIVTRIDPASNRVIARIKVGGAPRGLAIGSGRVWVSVAGTGRAAPAPGLSRAARVKALPSPPCGRVLTGGGDPDVLIASEMPLRDQLDTTLPMAEAVAYVLRERRFRAGRFKVGYQSCDDAIAQTGYSDGPKCRLNARIYARNPAVVGIVGPFGSPCAWLMIPVLNGAPNGPLALVSPSNSDPGLVRSEPTAADDVLARLYPTGQRGYARVHPSEDYEVAAGAMLARRLGDGAVFFLEDREVAAQGPRWLWFRRAAERIGLRIAGHATWSAQDPSFRALAERVRASGVHAVYINSSVEANAGRLLRALRTALGHDAAIIGGLPFLPVSELFEAAGPAARGVFVTVPGRTLDQLGARGKRFVRGFRATQSGGRVTPLVVYAAAATEVLLDAIARGDGTRASVTRALTTTRLPDSTIGRLGLDARGEPLTQPITVVRALHGRGRDDLVQGLDGTVPVDVITPSARLVGAGEPR